jgi:hypothetical protein
MKKTPRRRITVTSSLNEISTNQLGNRVVIRREGVSLPVPIPFSTAGFWTDTSRRRKRFFLLLVYLFIFKIHDCIPLHVPVE